jgi:hypothetical protein
MKVARLWSRLVDGEPVLDDTLERADESTPRAQILDFLSGGSGVLRASGYSEDWLVPSHPLVVPIGFRTDGIWLWSEELAYYLRVHNIVPEAAFLAHMSQRRFVAAAATASEIAEAEELLRDTSEGTNPHQ